MSFDKFLTKVFGSSNQRFLKSIRPIVEEINALEPEIQKLSDEQLRAKTAVFKAQIADAVKDTRDKDDRKSTEQEILDEILPEAFAIVREASIRTTGMRHFDVQLIGGIVLHQGKIAEMRTGEGKTLVATLPSYLNALTGAAAFTSLPSTIIWLRATRSGWARFIASSVWKSAVSKTTWTTSSGRQPTPPTSPTARTTNSASITCATT